MYHPPSFFLNPIPNDSCVHTAAHLHRFSQSIKMASAKLSDAAAVVDDMSRVFDASDDLQLIQSIRTNMSDILQQCQQKEQTVKDIIRGIKKSLILSVKVNVLKILGTPDRTRIISSSPRAGQQCDSSRASNVKLDRGSSAWRGVQD